ncbi:MAG: hypothetical protein WBG38_13550 [Nodosilinea sp.]
MKFHPSLVAASSLLAILSPSVAHADDGILSFDLPQPQRAAAAAPEVVDSTAALDPASQPLPIPSRAANPPMRYHSPQQLPAGVYRRAVAVALSESTSATALLPPAPPASANVILVAAAPAEPKSVPPAEAKLESESLALDFEVEPSAAVVALAQAKLEASKPPANPLLGLFEGRSDSLVARAVGSAEGTRTPDGSINPAYFGHTDPGNRVWNMGTFSYQHGANTPEEADQKQLARLQNQGDVLRQRALKYGLNLTLAETLNGLDLANQSPLAAIGRVGYIERLAEAKANGFEGPEAILVARTRAYINPNTGRWNAPGLGNTEPSIRRDQQRRARAVAQAIAVYESQNPQLQAQNWTLTPSPQPASEALVAQADVQESVDDFLRMWTSPKDPVAQVEPTDSALVSQSEASKAEGAYLLAASSSALRDGGLGTLWQSAVKKVSSASDDDAGELNSHPAPWTRALFKLSVDDDQLNQNQSGAVLEVEEPNLPVAVEPASLDSAKPAVEPAETSTDSEAADGADAPTWSEVREGSQSNPASEAESAAVTETTPDGVTYATEAAAAEPQAAPLAISDLAPPADDPETVPASEAPEPEAPDPADSSAPLTAADAAEGTPLEEAPSTLVSEPAPSTSSAPGAGSD